MKGRWIVYIVLAVLVAVIFVRCSEIPPTVVNSPSPPPISSPTQRSVTYSTFADVPKVPDTIVLYGGSTSFAPLRCDPKNEEECPSNNVERLIEEAHPKFKLTYYQLPSDKNPGSGKGIEMLLNGDLTIAQSSDAVKKEDYDEAKDQGFELKQSPIGYDAIAIFTHPEIDIPKLTLSELKDIYTGKITNWSKVGGSNIEIKPFSRSPENSGTAKYFQRTVLEGQPFASSIQSSYEGTTTGSIQNVNPDEQNVNQTKGGIGYATASEVCKQKSIRSLPIAEDGEAPVNPCVKDRKETNEVNIEAIYGKSYPITRTLFVVIRQDIRQDNGDLFQQAGEAYVNLLLSDEGQKLIKETGIAPIRSVE
jgi:phosphate transport system substrate-binding protein